MVGAWTVILAVDTPLTFVGDVMTLPIVHARQEGAPWATSWGLQAPITPTFHNEALKARPLDHAGPLENCEPEANPKR